MDVDPSKANKVNLIFYTHYSQGSLVPIELTTKLIQEMGRYLDISLERPSIKRRVCTTSSVSSRILPSTRGSSWHALSSSWSTLGCRACTTHRLGKLLSVQHHQACDNHVIQVQNHAQYLYKHLFHLRGLLQVYYNGD